MRGTFQLLGYGLLEPMKQLFMFTKLESSRLQRALGDQIKRTPKNTTEYRSLVKLFNSFATQRTIRLPITLKRVK